MADILHKKKHITSSVVAKYVTWSALIKKYRYYTDTVCLFCEVVGFHDPIDEKVQVNQMLAKLPAVHIWSKYIRNLYLNFQRRAKRWGDDEAAVAIHAAHERKETLHGKHRTYAGTEEEKMRLWQEVAGEFFIVCTINEMQCP